MHTGEEITSDALCVLFNKVLPNSSMLPAKLYEHVILISLKTGTKILVLSGISLRHYHSLTVKSSKTDNENATEASYRVSYHTAFAGEVHTVAETIINHVWCQQQLVRLVSSQK